MLIHDRNRNEEEGTSEQQNHDCGMKTVRMPFYSALARRSHERLSYSSHNPHYAKLGKTNKV